MDNSAVAYRILDPKQTLTGADGNALENVIIDPLQNGSLCWIMGGTTHDEFFCEGDWNSCCEW